MKAVCGNDSFVVGLGVGLNNGVGRREGCAVVAHTVVHIVILDDGLGVELLVGLFVVGLFVGPLEGLDITVVISAGGGSFKLNHRFVGFQIGGED